MPRDTQIFSGANHAGNSDYTLPGNSEIEVLAVNANFEDNGAGADWCPAVVMFSDSGHVIARAMLPDVKVTAGGDAEVSFFPGVKPGSAAAPGSTALAYAQAWRDFGDGAQSIADGSQDFADFPHATTTDATIMAWSTSVNPNDTLDMLAVGTYLPMFHSHWITTDPNGVSIIMTTGAGGIPHNPWVPDGNPLSGAAAGQANSQDYNPIHNSTGGGAIRFQHSNQTGGLRFVQQAYASVVYLGTG